MSESLTVECPDCAATLKLNTKGRSLEGRRVRCPRCGTAFPVWSDSEPADVMGGAGSPADYAGDADAADPAAAVVRPEDSVRDDFGDDWSQDRARYSGVSTASGQDGVDSEFQFGSTARKDLGFFGWVGFGLVAGLICAGLTTLTGYTDLTLLIAGMAVVTGIAAGAAVRLAAGPKQGGAPGTTAVMVALLCMLIGKVGAVYVSPEMNVIGGDILDEVDFLSPEQMEAEIAELTTEDGMISGIADEVEYDDEWLAENEITDDMIGEHWDQFSEEETLSARYLPKVWEEASRRWYDMSPEEQQESRQQRGADLRSEYGIMTEQEIADAVAEGTTEDEMIYYIAEWEVEEDPDWLADNNITEDQIYGRWNEAEDSSDPAQRFLPVVWKEANRRWAALSDKDRQQKIQERAAEIREENTWTEEDAEFADAALDTIWVIAVVATAIAGFFWPFGSLFCTIAGVAAAYRLGAGSLSA
ncbi:MAG: hypothetical protein RIK87_28040 [Fuerstiella sp.]